MKRTSAEELEQMSRDDESKRFYNQLRRKLAAGEVAVSPTPNRLFPDIEPWSVKQYLYRWWNRVELGKRA